VGDVIRLHKVTSSYYNDTLQIVGSVGKGKLLQSRPKLDAIMSCIPLPLPINADAVESIVPDAPIIAGLGWIHSFSSERMIFSEFDRKHIAKLYEWGSELLMRSSLAHFIEGGSLIENACNLHVVKSVLLAGNASMHNTYSLLQPQAIQPVDDTQREFITTTSKFDTICMVLKFMMSAASSSSPDPVVGRMYVWDGKTNGMTAVPPFARNDVLKSLRIAQRYTQCDNWTEISSNAMSTEVHKIAQDVHEEPQQQQYKLHGSMVELLVMDRAMADHLLNVKPGAWIRVRNVHIVASASAGVEHSARIDNDTHICSLHLFHK
jgi:hypothetical protein